MVKFGKVTRPILGIKFAPDQSVEQLGVSGVLVLDAPATGPAGKAETYQTKLFERNSQIGEGSNQQSDDSIYMEVVGGINKKGHIFGLGSQASTIKESLKFSPSISTDVVQPDKVAAMEAKIEALTVELEQKNLDKKR
ncbi:uncharacterized protein LOC123918802 [Trifolium pratense]|uniref:uncharacterized protein LOC123918802 n=1 Tax=Trifolium pratense TaxID=57577 RepID=UPI001E69552A|nr:uncharacterized protein LOC123918802 [Trifolium pratense]XP_045826905.1 uncharacterized protein LOC123918802 [Trifolium pratense]